VGWGGVYGFGEGCRGCLCGSVWGCGLVCVGITSRQGWGGKGGAGGGINSIGSYLPLQSRVKCVRR